MSHLIFLVNIDFHNVIFPCDYILQNIFNFKNQKHDWRVMTMTTQTRFCKVFIKVSLKSFYSNKKLWSVMVLVYLLYESLETFNSM